MQRNWDAIRKILLKIEALPTEDSVLESTEMEGLDRDASAYHLRLLLEAGLIVGGCRDALGPPWCYASRLTWEGHELLDKIRRDTVWNKVKETARVKGVELSVDVVRTLARQVIDALLA